MSNTETGKLRHEIITEELEKYLKDLPPGGKLPPVRTLMDHFKISQATMDRSLRSLEQKKQVERIAGRGYFRRNAIGEEKKTPKIDLCFFLKKNVVGNPLYSKISDCMLSEMYHLGCFMNIFAYEDVGSISEFRKRVCMNKPDVFLMIACSKVSFRHVLKELGIPVIQIYPNVIENDVLSYIIDNEKAVRIVIDHLCGLGHQRIALMHGQGYEGCHMLDQEERIEAFYRIMAEKNLSTNGHLVKYGGFSPEEGYAAACELLDLPSRMRPTAIFGNDYNAPGIYRAAQERGIRIPQDLSVVGFDRLSIINFMQPSLTTLDICAEEMVKDVARKAKESAQTGIQGEGVLRTGVELIQGKSTGTV